MYVYDRRSPKIVTQNEHPGTGWDGTGQDGTGQDGMGRIFGRTDLRISPSKAKFDDEAHFDVCLAVEPRKPRSIDEKLHLRSKISAEKNFQRRKTKHPKSSQTRFGKVSHRSERCSRIYENFSSRIYVPDLNP